MLPEAATAPHVEITDAPLDGVGLVIHAGRYRPSDPGAWKLDEDLETHLMQRVENSGARYVMLSTRAVYASGGSGALDENHPTVPTSVYGRHKLRLEEHGRALLGDRLLVTRLSNVFGFEWPGRTTFFGTMLGRLKEDGTIRFDMSPATRRDFVPVEMATAIIAGLTLDWQPGVVNVGAGRSLECGTLAQAVMSGFGGGRLIVTDEALRDPFHLDTSLARRRTGIEVTERIVLDAAAAAGRRLALAE